MSITLSFLILYIRKIKTLRLKNSALKKEKKYILNYTKSSLLAAFPLYEFI